MEAWEMLRNAISFSVVAVKIKRIPYGFRDVYFSMQDEQ
jgi:hypothetical protein